MDIIQIITGRILFNFIGACIRWIFGTIWRTIANREKYKFQEYLNGPEKSKDWFDQNGHQFNNRIIGILTIIGLIILILYLDKN